MTNIEEKLEQALYKAIDVTSETGDASKAVAKVASDMNLSPKEIKFVANAYNTSKSFALGSTLDETSRPAEFDLAEPDSIIQDIYPDMDKVASYDDDTVILPDLDAVENAPMLKKAASEFDKEFTNYTPSLSNHDKDVLLRKISKLENNFADTKSVLCKALHKTASQNRERMKQAIHKAADEYIKYPDKNKEKVVRRILNGFEPKISKIALETIEKLSGKDVPKVQKTASHNIFPSDKIYQYIADMKDYAYKVRKTASLYNDIQKTGALGDVAEKATGAMLPRGSLMDEFRSALGDRPREKTWKEEMPADHFVKLKALEARDAFMKALIKNPHLQEFSLPALQDAFNYTMETNPELVDKPQELANVMLHNINTQGIDDLYALQTKEGLSKSEADKSKAKEQVKDIIEAREEKTTKERRDAKDKAKVKIPEGEASAKVREKIMEAPKKGLGDLGAKMDELLEASGKTYKHKLERDKEKREKEEDSQLSDEEKERIERENRAAALASLERKAPLKGFSPYSTTSGTTVGTKYGLLDLPVKYSTGQSKALSKDELARLQKAKEQGVLTQEGERMYTALTSLAKELSKNPVTKSHAAKRAAWYGGPGADISSGIPVQAASLDELITP